MTALARKTLDELAESDGACIDIDIREDEERVVCNLKLITGHTPTHLSAEGHGTVETGSG